MPYVSEAAEDVVDVPPEQVQQFVRREVLAWLEGAFAADPSPAAAAALYAGALAAVVEFTWQTLGPRHTPATFQCAVALAVRATLADLIERPATVQ